MATDARGHTVPAASDVPSRNTLLNLGLSIKDIMPVTNTTTRAAAATAITPSATNPLLVLRADARSDHLLELSIDGGTTWQSIPLSTGVVTTFVPAFTATGGGVTLGTGGTATAQYEKNGQSVVGSMAFLFGTASVSVGSGLYQVSLPFTTNGPLGTIVGSGTFFDSSGSAWTTFELRTDSTTTARLQITAGTNTSLGSTNPGVGINDKIEVEFAYLAA